MTEGQLLVQLDTAELAVKLAQADADLAAARAAAGGRALPARRKPRCKLPPVSREHFRRRWALRESNVNRTRDD